MTKWLIPKLALRNLLGAGLRTWLNVIVLSMSFVAIIVSTGLNDGLLDQATRALLTTQFGGGQYWQEDYDPYDLFTLDKAHAALPETLEQVIHSQQATPLLVVQGAIFPGGRIQPVLLKGIDPKQKILDLPTETLRNEDVDLPVLIGSRMAKSSGLNVGDPVTIRWRDVHGTFDAREGTIVQVMNVMVPSVDTRQLWLPLAELQEMMDLQNEATLVVLRPGFDSEPLEVAGWTFRNLGFLLKDLHDLMRIRLIGRSIFYVILLFLALIAIFDTQILSIFKRRKEIGTLISLGMTRTKVIQLFTLEGTLHGILAALLATLYGAPLMAWLRDHGIPVPQSAESLGVPVGHILYPRFGVLLVLGTVLTVLVSVTIVSYWPVRQIAEMQPTDALRGKMP